MTRNRRHNVLYKENKVAIRWNKSIKQSRVAGRISLQAFQNIFPFSTIYSFFKIYIFLNIYLFKYISFKYISFYILSKPDYCCFSHCENFSAFSWRVSCASGRVANCQSWSAARLVSGSAYWCPPFLWARWSLPICVSCSDWPERSSLNTWHQGALVRHSENWCTQIGIFLTVWGVRVAGTSCPWYH